MSEHGEPTGRGGHALATRPPREADALTTDGPDAPTNDAAGGDASRHRWPVWLLGAGPLVLLALLLVALFRLGPLGLFDEAFPPVEELTIERIWFPEPGEMRVAVVNGGPEPVTIAQVVVDEAVWSHELDGNRTVGRLERRVITIPYPWVEGEPHGVQILTQTGITFEGGVDVATTAPAVGARYLGAFALLGVYVGVLPVLLGLLWLPFLRRIDRRWVDFFLALTVGLLAFLGVDALLEAFEVAESVPGAFQGTGLILIGALGTPLALTALGRSRRRGDGTAGPWQLALLVALAIGLHNLGEGLAIGGAYASGAIALGAFLVVGFLVHNTTEGLAIVAPLAREETPLGRLILLGLLAGVPTVLGAWIGGFTRSPISTTLFLAVGAGAVAQVILELTRFFGRRAEHGLTAPLNAVGLLAGMAIMYLTGLLVTG
ncbi:MAG TPA: ZIP family metal transporter [Longimicrobiales bacterium]|nr:ZIP family metal transporter [Longimicrobiales bacterium]